MSLDQVLALWISASCDKSSNGHGDCRVIFRCKWTVVTVAILSGAAILLDFSAVISTWDSGWMAVSFLDISYTDMWKLCCEIQIWDFTTEILQQLKHGISWSSWFPVPSCSLVNVISFLRLALLSVYMQPSLYDALSLTRCHRYCCGAHSLLSPFN